MFSPGMLGVDPEKQRQMQELTRHIRVSIRRSVKQKQFRVIFTPDGNHPQAEEVASAMVGRLTSDLVTQLYTVFAMQGEMVDVD